MKNQGDIRKRNPKAPKDPKPRKQIEKRAEVLIKLFSDRQWRSYEEIKEVTGYLHPNKAMTAVGYAGYEVERQSFYNPKTGKNNLMKVRVGEKLPRAPIVRTSITSRDKEKLFIRDKYNCCLCKEKFKKAELRADHRYSLIKHGETVYKSDPHWMDKLQTLCHWCNYEKREVCNGCQLLDCSECSFAYPENFNMISARLTKSQAELLGKVCSERGVSTRDFVQKLISDALT